MPKKVGSTKTEMPRNRCARRRRSTTSLAHGSPAYQATPSRRDATMTTLLPGVILGFPPVRARTGTMASPNALQEERVAPAGVTAPVSVKPTGNSPDPRSPALDAPSCSTTLAAHHLTPPRPCKHHRRLTVTNELGTSGTRRAIREREAAQQ